MLTTHMNSDTSSPDSGSVLNQLHISHTLNDNNNNNVVENNITGGNTIISPTHQNHINTSNIDNIVNTNTMLSTEQHQHNIDNNNKTIFGMYDNNNNTTSMYYTQQAYDTSYVPSQYSNAQYISYTQPSIYGMNNTTQATYNTQSQYTNTASTQPHYTTSSIYTHNSLPQSIIPSQYITASAQQQHQHQHHNTHPTAHSRQASVITTYTHSYTNTMTSPLITTNNISSIHNTPLQLPHTQYTMSPPQSANNITPSPYTYSRLLKISGRSDVKNTAGSIAHTSRSGECPILLCTGALSVNQAIKAICIARKYISENDIDLVIKPEFRNEEKQQYTLICIKSLPNIDINKNNNKNKHDDNVPLSITSSTSSGTNSGTNTTVVNTPNTIQSTDSSIIDQQHSIDQQLQSTASQLLESPSDKPITAGVTVTNLLSDSHELRVANGSEPSLTAGSIAKKIRNNERIHIVSIGAGSILGTVCAITIAQRYLIQDNLELTFQPEFIHVHLNGGQCSAIKFNIYSHRRHNNLA